MRRSIQAVIGLLALPCAASALAATTTLDRQRASARTALVFYGGEITRYERETRHWQRVMGLRLTPARALASAARPRVARTEARRWRRLAAATLRRAEHPPNLGAWLCIHRYEGSWSDGLGPYYGGLQMDLGFQETYAPWLLRTKGTADHWTPLEQIWTAARAARTRGFWPWPTSGRLCGLI